MQRPQHRASALLAAPARGVWSALVQHPSAHPLCLRPPPAVLAQANAGRVVLSESDEGSGSDDSDSDEKCKSLAQILTDPKLNGMYSILVSVSAAGLDPQYL